MLGEASEDGPAVRPGRDEVSRLVAHDLDENAVFSEFIHRRAAGPEKLDAPLTLDAPAGQVPPVGEGRSRSLLQDRLDDFLGAEVKIGDKGGSN